MENERLKKEIESLKEENERLKQENKSIISKIDKQKDNDKKLNLINTCFKQFSRHIEEINKPQTFASVANMAN